MREAYEDYLTKHTCIYGEYVGPLEIEAHIEAHKNAVIVMG
jgi:hypothetical protein